MIETQIEVTKFHNKHGLPIHTSIEKSHGVKRLYEKIIYFSISQLSKLCLFFWDLTGKNHELIFRTHLILEELSEMMAALSNGDEKESADGLGDLLYVVVGVGVVYKLPCYEINQAICRSNATKQPRTSDNLRLRNKGWDFKPPDIEEALRVGRKRIEKDLIVMMEED